MGMGRAHRRRPTGPVVKNFSELTEQELLALAVSLEEEDNRTYSDFAAALRDAYPGTAKLFSAMADEEDRHRHRLLDLYRQKFGERIPFLHRGHLRSTNRSPPGCLARHL